MRNLFTVLFCLLVVSGFSQGRLPSTDILTVTNKIMLNGGNLKDSVVNVVGDQINIQGYKRFRSFGATLTGTGVIAAFGASNVDGLINIGFDGANSYLEGSIYGSTILRSRLNNDVTINAGTGEIYLNSLTVGTTAEFTGNVIAATPTLSTHLTTKDYVDDSLLITAKKPILTGGSSTGGVANLIGGTATINTTKAGGTVFFSLQNCNSCGIISQGTVVSGTSFVINSSNSGDTSAVAWWIID